MQFARGGWCIIDRADSCAALVFNPSGVRDEADCGDEGRDVELFGILVFRTESRLRKKVVGRILRALLSSISIVGLIMESS